MRVSLDSIRASFTTLVIVGIVITTVLLAMAGLVIFSRRFAIYDRARIDNLYEWRQSIEPDLKKLPQLQESAVGVLQLPAELEQTLQQLLKALDKKASDSLPKKESAGASLEQKSTGQVKEERGQVVTALNDQLEVKGSSQKAIEWYQSLLLNKAPSPNPLYLSINFPLTDRSAMSANRRICLNEIPHQGPFVLFRESDDARVGWIFPNPASNFAPDHKWVFTHLNQANFEQQKAGISPRRLQFQEGLWLLAL
jgi:hypothetical protein